ncbi:hypothetical protein M8J76_003890 [Diaphorina citri]|nr:hypothetical protein M8J75_005175 [Diaphorina citri]KAI5723294.1 hypothetical protein M8J76_003890 [Diaphorina citri]
MTRRRSTGIFLSANLRMATSYCTLSRAPAMSRKITSTYFERLDTICRFKSCIQATVSWPSTKPNCLAEKIRPSPRFSWIFSRSTRSKTFESSGNIVSGR